MEYKLRLTEDVTGRQRRQRKSSFQNAWRKWPCGKHTIQTGGGILLHQFHSPLIPLLNLLAAFTIQCIPSFKYLFSSAPHFLSFILFYFFNYAFYHFLFCLFYPYCLFLFYSVHCCFSMANTSLFFFFLSTARNVLFSFLHSVCLFLSTLFSLLHFLFPLKDTSPLFLYL